MNIGRKFNAPVPIDGFNRLAHRVRSIRQTARPQEGGRGKAARTCSLGARLLVLLGARATDLGGQVRWRYRCATGCRFGVRSGCEVFLGLGEGELLQFDAVAENPFDPTL
jgi:hypothetical protein